MLLFNLILLAVTVALERDENCPANTDNTFCELVERETENYDTRCNDPSADLLPHPKYCTLYIQCICGEKGRSSITKCCPPYDTDGDGCFDKRLWFNPDRNPEQCDYSENVTRTCSLPVANISTNISVQDQCPDGLADLPNTAFSPSTGCIWAEPDESQMSGNYEKAVARCR